uniref:Uncharacterized protein n=1 Tax=Panagrolaimus davidi TaxID=227884 RepID=A0A914P5N5_9BILA
MRNSHCFQMSDNKDEVMSFDGSQPVDDLTENAASSGPRHDGDTITKPEVSQFEIFKQLLNPNEASIIGQKIEKFSNFFQKHPRLSVEEIEEKRRLKGEETVPSTAKNLNGMDLTTYFSSLNLQKNDNRAPSSESATLETSRKIVVNQKFPIPNQTRPDLESSFSHPPIFTYRKRNYSGKYFTSYVEHLSTRYTKAMELCDKLDKRVFDILWSFFPDILICIKCKNEFERKEHKKLFWDFREASICCSRCIVAENLRCGFVTSLVSFLSPTFHQSIERNLERDVTTYDKFIPTFGFRHIADSFSALNGLRKFTSDIYSRKQTELRNELYNAHVSKLVENGTKEDIEKIQAMILRENACNKVVDICFAFAIKKLPTYIPKIACECAIINSCFSHCFLSANVTVISAKFL